MKNILDARAVHRNQIVAVIVVISLVVSPHLGNIHHAVLASFFAMTVWKILAQWVSWLPVNRWLIILCAIVFFSISAWHYGPPLGRDPGVSFLIVLLGLKALECKSRRDVRVMLILGYFVVITHFLYLNSLGLVLLLFFALVALTVMMMQMGHANPHGKIKSDFALTARLVVLAIPFTVIMFFLFPRFAGSFWLIHSPSSAGSAGMSRTMTMGAISQLVGSQDSAFTATFYGDHVPRPQERYWRTGILWHTDGREWFPGEHKTALRTTPAPQSIPFEYEMEISPSRENWIHALDIPLFAPEGMRMTPEHYLVPEKRNQTISRYLLKSSSLVSKSSISEQQFAAGTKLAPGMLTPRIKKLVDNTVTAASSNGQFSTDSYIIQLLEYYRNNPFTYTLQPPLLTSATPVDEFLFGTRQGFCEHYSASLVTLMRAANIPSRIVIGYLGGELNPLTNQINVIQSDAHAWAEYWSEKHGWRRVDPTAAVAPQRIDNSINYELSLGSDGDVHFLTLENQLLGTLFRDIRWYGGLIKQNWERWFVGFDFKRQQTLLNNIGLDNVPIRSLALVAFLIAVIALTFGTIVAYWNDRDKPDPIVSAYEKFCIKASKAGITKLPWEGPMDFYLRCKKQYPQLAGQLNNINELYLSLRYGRGHNSEKLDKLKSEIRSIRFS